MFFFWKKAWKDSSSLKKKKIKKIGPEFSSMYFFISELYLLACKLSDLSL